MGGWRFRKSKSLLGGLVRLTLGRRGVGVSVGRRGFRVSRSPDGTVRRSLSIPGLGLSRSDVVRKRRRRR